MISRIRLHLGIEDCPSQGEQWTHEGTAEQFVAAVGEHAVALAKQALGIVDPIPTGEDVYPGYSVCRLSKAEWTAKRAGVRPDVEIGPGIVDAEELSYSTKGALELCEAEGVDIATARKLLATVEGRSKDEHGAWQYPGDGLIKAIHIAKGGA